MPFRLWNPVSDQIIQGIAVRLAGLALKKSSRGIGSCALDGCAGVDMGAGRAEDPGRALKKSSRGHWSSALARGGCSASSCRTPLAPATTGRPCRLASPDELLLDDARRLPPPDGGPRLRLQIRFLPSRLIENSSLGKRNVFIKPWHNISHLTFADAARVAQDHAQSHRRQCDAMANARHAEYHVSRQLATRLQMQNA